MPWAPGTAVAEPGKKWLESVATLDRVSLLRQEAGSFVTYTAVPKAWTGSRWAVSRPKRWTGTEWTDLP